MRIRGAIFDADGTLLDSMDLWDGIGGIYLRSLGYEPREDLNRVLKDMSLAQAARYLRREYGVPLPEDAITDGINALLEHSYRHEIPLKPGARALLETLRRGGVRLCVATATDRYLVEAALDRCGVLSFFGEIFTCGALGCGKDDPRIFEEALRFLGTERAETLVFDDALYALRTAKAAGFPAAAVYDSHETAQEELRQLADLYLEDLTQLQLIRKHLPA